MSTEPRVVVRYFRWPFPVRCELSLHIYLDIPPVTGQIAKAKRRDARSKNARPGLSQRFLSVQVPRGNKLKVMYITSVYRIIHCTLFRRPQYPEL